MSDWTVSANPSKRAHEGWTSAHQASIFWAALGVVDGVVGEDDPVGVAALTMMSLGGPDVVSWYAAVVPTSEVAGLVVVVDDPGVDLAPPLLDEPVVVDVVGFGAVGVVVEASSPCEARPWPG